MRLPPVHLATAFISSKTNAIVPTAHRTLLHPTTIVSPKQRLALFATQTPVSMKSKAATQAEGDRELQEAQIINDTAPAQAVDAANQLAVPKASAHEKAFDLFDSGKLSEKALLIAVGAERSGFELAEDLRLRTLTSFEDGRLSEDAMIKLLS